MVKYLLCRPPSGLNDSLVQIERCCRYAEEFGRTVIVDSNHATAAYFHDRFDRYFTSIQRRLILSVDGLTEALNGRDVFPEQLRGRLNDHGARYDGESGLVVDRESDVPVTFDFARDYPHDLLVHQQVGGGRISAICLLRMTLAESLCRELERRLDAIGGPYAAIHVRHTDLRSRYQEAIALLKSRPRRRLFVATDNRLVLQDFVDALGEEWVLSFSSLDYPPGEPLHLLALDPDRRYERNRDAILDLLMLALSQRLFVIEVENKATGKHSGYSQLALDLFRSKVILRHFLAGSALRFGLD